MEKRPPMTDISGVDRGKGVQVITQPRSSKYLHLHWHNQTLELLQYYNDKVFSFQCALARYKYSSKLEAKQSYTLEDHQIKSRIL